MKKFIFMLTVLLSSVMSMNAQSIDLEGRWIADVSEDNEYMTLIFVFEGNELTQAIYAESDVEEIGFVGVIVATPPAPFKLDGNKLTVTSDSSEADFQVTKTEFNDKVKDAIKLAPSMENTMKELLDQAFESQKVDMAKTMLFPPF